METMSFRFGIDDYFYYNNSVRRKNNKTKEIVSTEVYFSKFSNKGEKNKES